MSSSDKNDRHGCHASLSKVFIQRDYTRGTSVQFQSKYPLELEGKIPRNVFDATIKHINGVFDDAEKCSARTYLQGCFACLTAYLIYMCMDTYYDKCMKNLAQYLHDQNENVYIPRGVQISHPMERGLRVVSFQQFRSILSSTILSKVCKRCAE